MVRQTVNIASNASGSGLEHISRTWARHLKNNAKTIPHRIPQIMKDTVPIIDWAPRYNLGWVINDVISGLTVGMMVVPQALAYAKLASLPVQYGLYTAFVGPIIYCLFGTSKDISVGPATVLSVFISQTAVPIAKETGIPAPYIASAIAFLSGILLLALSLLRLGMVVDLISSPVIAGFTSGSALTIICSQLPKLFGVSGIDTSEAAYEVLFHVLKGVPKIHWRELLVGLASCVALELIRIVCAKYSKKAVVIRYIGVGRNFIVVALFTLISFLTSIGRDAPQLSVIGKVPKGFQAPRAPTLTSKLVSEVGTQVFSAALLIVLEHMAVSKAFGRVDKYEVRANNEFMALGVINIVGSFFGSYTATGVFSRSAVNNASGVKTPLSGIYAALIVILSLLFLPPLFFYIPNATLAAVIVCSVYSLICGPKFYFRLWQVDPLDCVVSAAALAVTFFVSVEIGIYISVGMSIVILLYRVARPRIALMSELLHRPEHYGDQMLYETNRNNKPGIVAVSSTQAITFSNASYLKDCIIKQVWLQTDTPVPQKKDNERLWSCDTNGHVSRVRKEHYMKLKTITQNNELLEMYTRNSRSTHCPGDICKDYYGNVTPIGLTRIQTAPSAHSSDEEKLPYLRALILDLGSVGHIDATGLQVLYEIRDELDDYAGANHDPLNYQFELHFVNVRPPVLRKLEISGLTWATSALSAMCKEDIGEKLLKSHSFNSSTDKPSQTGDIDLPQTLENEDQPSSAERRSRRFVGTISIEEISTQQVPPNMNRAGSTPTTTCALLSDQPLNMHINFGAASSKRWMVHHSIEEAIKDIETQWKLLSSIIP
ncbi:hypothetical protein H4219_000038 [Mycoemilia scoparia]|uniref:STAS domain-containing protein n=1 Tax=Mycoemilia scoparia TaxID=417184 RepID=A0A9W8A988_9FUNG|nr:hypothetical protein H4219_000038 [Mycoemilia scoparia]